jgi:putative transposase
MMFKPNSFYHLYNHAISNERLFLCDDNFRYFLEKYFIYTQPFAHTFAYCLMPNHFHVLIRIKDENDLWNNLFFDSMDSLAQKSDFNTILHQKISKQLSNFFNAYAKAFNKMYNRDGKLFRNSMQYKEIDNISYLKNLIHYIHLNPVMHCFVKYAEEWTFSSFNTFVDNCRNINADKHILTLFSDHEDYKRFHKQFVDKKLIAELEY